ncbi:hypothetical protein EST38_g13906 [Candolleomyces aberdarensis]|uniref:F-box domain-containing protein n=1 Tax=Candolleomyces aberdarensis TaxID=2316362 RepID=A0A4Q2CZM2_9AGAR|nr:hypothetical protein EST38_g13906 [Candolleomyces aberdarensis]
MSAGEDHRLEDLLDSNIPPSSLQSSMAQAAIESFDQVLTPLNENIADLQRQLVELQTRKEAVEARRQKYLDIVSARRRIPNEIVGAFVEEAYIPSLGESPSLPFMLFFKEAHRPPFKGESPLLPFMLVSRAWYRAVCGTARLWTTLYLDLRSTGEEADVRRVVEKATTWYSRAGSVPLTLSLSLSSLNPNNHIFIDYLHSIANKLGNLDFKIEMDTSSDVDFLQQVFRDPDSKGIAWPNMKKLHLSIRSGREVQLADVITHPYKQFQALEDFSIRAHGAIAKFDMPWETLTTLRLGPFSVIWGQGMTYCSILSSCQNLRSLHVGIHRYGSDDARLYINASHVRVTLPHLTNLSVEHGFLCQHACTSLLESLVLPSLQSFSCKYTAPDSTIGYSEVPLALTKLIMRSHNPNTIKSISLGLGNALSPGLEDLGGLFSEVPGLEVLELSGGKIDVELMEVLPGALNELTLRLAVEAARVEFTKYLDDNAPLRARVRIVGSKSRQR